MCSPPRSARSNARRPDRTTLTPYSQSLCLAARSNELETIDRGKQLVTELEICGKVWDRHEGARNMARQIAKSWERRISRQHSCARVDNKFRALFSPIGSYRRSNSNC
jgi:hypothetical protein